MNNSTPDSPAAPSLHLPAHLRGHEASGAHPGEPIAQFEIGEMKNFVYLLIDWESRECAIVDSQTDLSSVRETMSRHQLKPVAILLTHTHHDHIAGLAELIQTHPEIPVYVHEHDYHRIPKKLRGEKTFQFIKDGDRIQVGKLQLEVLHTPGHSLGECCYFLASNPPYLFTGDTIFIRDCGRTDLPGGSTLDMFDSIQRIKKLPPKTVILCGHHYQPEIASNLAHEGVDSPPFRARTVNELEALP